MNFARVALFLAFSGTASAAPTSAPLRDLIVRGAVASTHGFVVKNDGRYPRDNMSLSVAALLEKEGISPDLVRCVDDELKKERAGDLLRAVLDLVTAFKNVGHKHQMVVAELEAAKERREELNVLREQFAENMNSFRENAIDEIAEIQVAYRKAQMTARSIANACTRSAVAAPRAPRNP